MMRSCKVIISNCLCIDWSHYFFNLIIGMAIFARPADTRPSSVLMDRILPGLIKNRVKFGFLQKPGPNPYPALPGYIYIYIVITLTEMPHLTHNLFKLQSRLSFLSSTHSPLPLLLTLLSCLSPLASLMLSCSSSIFSLFD